MEVKLELKVSLEGEREGKFSKAKGVKEEGRKLEKLSFFEKRKEKKRKEKKKRKRVSQEEEEKRVRKEEET